MQNNTYTGIYRAVVIDNADPLGKGRVKLMVPQVSGEAVTEWAWPIGGTISQHKYPYATLTKTTSQVISVPNTEYVITHDTVEDSNGITINGSRVYVEHSGNYFIQYSTTFRSESSSAKVVDVWFKLNGTGIPRSNTQFIMSGNPNQRNTTKGGVLDLKTGDYVEIAWASDSSGVSITTDPATSLHPTAAGSVFTIFMVGKFTPNPGDGVWAMFEGGDPNYPLWTGVF